MTQIMHFDEWNEQKKSLHSDGHIPRISEGSVYWCGFGENVGVEINGKKMRCFRDRCWFIKVE